MAAADRCIRSTALMGTVVSLEVVGHGETAAERADRDDAIDRALDWFRAVEDCTSRFDAESEVSRLASRTGEAVAASPMLVTLVHFALTIAEDTNGAFDPTLGALMESRGDNVHYRSGNVVNTRDLATPVGWRDVHVNVAEQTIMLDKPILLDLGGVAKGLAIDLAARELSPLEDFAIDAGGDLYCGGVNALRSQWTVGIKHPRDPESFIQRLAVSNAAVCTSGDYGRQHHDDEHHLIDPRTQRSARACASVTVVAPTAMVADALATAAFVLGPGEGMALLERHGAHGLLVTPDLAVFATAGMPEFFA